MSCRYNTLTGLGTVGVIVFGVLFGLENKKDKKKQSKGKWWGFLGALVGSSLLVVTMIGLCMSGVTKRVEPGIPSQYLPKIVPPKKLRW